MQSPAEASPARSRRSATERGFSVKWFLFFWLLVIGLGAYGAHYYINSLKEQVIVQLSDQSRQQLAAVQQNYENRLEALSAEVNQLESQVQSFNELLTFTKDNANEKTDNSNKLYTQLGEVRKQLDELKKELDLLK